MPIEHKHNQNNVTVDIDALNDVLNDNPVNTGSGHSTNRMIYVIYISTRSSILDRKVNICTPWNLRLWYRLGHHVRQMGKEKTKSELKWALFALEIAFEL
jgi:hypothetical protein